LPTGRHMRENMVTASYVVRIQLLDIANTGAVSTAWQPSPNEVTVHSRSLPSSSVCDMATVLEADFPPPCLNVARSPRSVRFIAPESRLLDFTKQHARPIQIADLSGVAGALFT
jgi:hypothetical protein